jgi:Restriction endonuclease
MTRSRYDDLHDRYEKIDTTKAGTRYERLAALVFKKLDAAGTVIHDLKLVGDTTVAHQIDVSIERAGVPYRILVECKDFAGSEEKVGLGIVRDFSAVIADTKPDESYIVTTRGFTRDAITFARAKGITLATLRTFREEDWKGRIRTISFNVTAVTHSPPTVQLSFFNELDRVKLRGDCDAAGIGGVGADPNDPLYFVTSRERVQANAFVAARLDYNIDTASGPRSHDIDVAGLSVEVQERGPVELAAVRISYDVIRITEAFEAGGDRIAELILKGVGGSDVVVWDKDLAAFRIDDDTHEVEAT